MSRVLPSPALSTALFILWILLMQPASPGGMLLGAALAVVWPIGLQELRSTPARIHKPRVAIALFFRVVADMVRSNLAVGAAILAPPSRQPRSRFVVIPLELRDPHGLSALAMIITFTPGTVWGQLSADQRVLLIHALDTEESEAVSHIKRYYEGPLREIFE